MTTATQEHRSVQAARTWYEADKPSRLVVILVVGMFAASLPWPGGLGQLPLQNVLKNKMHLTATATASFFLYGSLFWYLKPIAGMLTDSFPLFGTRRRSYLLGAATMAAVAWIATGLVGSSYAFLLLGVLLVNLFVVVISTVMGAVLVEVGRSRSETGRFTAIRMITYSSCGVLQGFAGGFLATLPFVAATVVNAALVWTIFPVALVLLREPSVGTDSRKRLAAAQAQVRTMAASGPFWACLGFLGLFYFAPGISTLRYFRQNDVLHLSQQAIGWLMTVNGVGGVAAAALYGALARRLTIHRLLAVGVVAGGLSAAVYVFYNSPSAAWAIDLQYGFFSGFASVALFDLAARASPAGCEGLAYALMMSVNNLAWSGGDTLGAYWSDHYHLSWNTMVMIDAATTVSIALLLPFMPRVIMAGIDKSLPRVRSEAPET